MTQPNTEGQREIRFRVPVEMWTAMRQAADNDYRTITGWLRGVIKEAIENDKEKKLPTGRVTIIK